jgi:serine/threonine protein kinase
MDGKLRCSDFGLAVPARDLGLRGSFKEPGQAKGGFCLCATSLSKIGGQMRPSSSSLFQCPACCSACCVFHSARFYLRCRSQPGTLFFVPPEAFRNEFSFASDVWACGILLYVLLTGALACETTRVPFETKCAC